MVKKHGLCNCRLQCLIIAVIREGVYVSVVNQIKAFNAGSIPHIPNSFGNDQTTQ